MWDRTGHDYRRQLKRGCAWLHTWIARLLLWLEPRRACCPVVLLLVQFPEHPMQVQFLHVAVPTAVGSHK